MYFIYTLPRPHPPAPGGRRVRRLPARARKKEGRGGACEGEGSMGCGGGEVGVVRRHRW